MNARSAAYAIILQFTTNFSRLDELISDQLKPLKLSNREIRLIYNLTSGVVRHLSTLDWKISKIYAGNYRKALNKLKTVLRLAFFEIDYLDYIPAYATVNEYVSLAAKILDKRNSKLVNGVLRAYLRQTGKYNPAKAFKFPKSRLSVQYAYPEWMIEYWLNEWGEEETERFCQASNSRPEFGLRHHPSLIEEDQLLSLLKKNRIEYTASPFFESVYKLTDIQSLRRLRVFEKGYCAIQDESAVIAVKLLNPEKDDFILDACAAPGGKFTGILHTTADQNRSTGLDVSWDRLQIVRQNCSVQNLHNYNLIQGDARQTPFNKEFDKIIIDAPCSGLGTIQKHPDIKWRRQPEEIEEFHALQLRILEEMAELVRPGGAIVYSTCTVGRRENEDVIHAFLSHHNNDFSLTEPPDLLREFTDDRYYIKTFPNIHKMDGSFCVKLLRTDTV